ncbi:naphthoate synthase [Rothia aeria]|uniref:Naphthoate synthase n=1 Tax=Rothia aeria TaxID=172042 RepID=A0A2Z5R2N4_9MICC|nr:naphthoate synthase [Rothia aeria]
MTVTFPPQVSDIFNPQHWRIVDGFEDFTDITYHRQVQRDETGEILRDLPTVRIAFNRPEVRNAFRPHTVDELYRALDHARMTSDVGAVLLTGNGPSPKMAGGRSARAVTSASVGATATTTPAATPPNLLTLHVLGGCIFWRCSA